MLNEVLPALQSRIGQGTNLNIPERYLFASELEPPAMVEVLVKSLQDFMVEQVDERVAHVAVVLSYQNGYVEVERQVQEVVALFERFVDFVGQHGQCVSVRDIFYHHRRAPVLLDRIIVYVKQSEAIALPVPEISSAALEVVLILFFKGAVEGERLDRHHQVSSVVVAVPGGDVAATKYCPLRAHTALVATVWALPNVDFGDFIKFQLQVFFGWSDRVLSPQRRNALLFDAADDLVHDGFGHVGGLAALLLACLRTEFNGLLNKCSLRLSFLASGMRLSRVCGRPHSYGRLDSGGSFLIGFDGSHADETLDVLQDFLIDFKPTLQLFLRLGH